MKPMPVRIVSLLVLSCLSAVAQAAAYKCVQADGRFSFQDQPCAAGQTASKVALAPAAAPASAPVAAKASGRPSWQDQLAESDRRRAEAERKEQVDRAHAQNKAQRCNAARSQLGILKEGHAVFTRDNSGNRQYLEDKDRAAAVQQAERRVSTECQ